MIAHSKDLGTRMEKDLTSLSISVRNVHSRIIKIQFSRPNNIGIPDHSGVAWASVMLVYFFCRFLVTLLVTVVVDSTGAIFLDALF